MSRLFASPRLASTVVVAVAQCATALGLICVSRRMQEKSLRWIFRCAALLMMISGLGRLIEGLNRTEFRSGAAPPMEIFFALLTPIFAGVLWIWILRSRRQIVALNCAEETRESRPEHSQALTADSTFFRVGSEPRELAKAEIRRLNESLEQAEVHAADLAKQSLVYAGKGGFTSATKTAGALLLVDDDEAVREVATYILKNAGFIVTAAEDGRMAVEIVAQGLCEFEVVLLDLTMPRMDGEETFRGLRTLRPNLPIIIMSGYSEQETAQRFIGESISGIVPKPFTAEVLLAKIREVTGRSNLG